jgi:hypothetical protein
MKPSDQAMARARTALTKVKQLFDAAGDYPGPKCSICGKVIYCGVNSWCKENPCGLRKVK